MEISSLHPIYPIYGLTPPAIRNVTTWMRVWDELPSPGKIAPVWDGTYLYYAVYWQKEGKQFWIVTEQIGVNLDDLHLRKTAGEQVFPLQWLKIEAPTT